MADQHQEMVNGHGLPNGHGLVNGLVNGHGVVNVQGVNGQGESEWEGLEETSQDPEEARVMFCALDSFL